MQPPLVEGRNVRLQWNTSGSLEVAPTPQGPWRPADGSGETISLHERAMSDQGRFFRVREKDGTISEVGQLVSNTPEKPLSVQQANVRALADGTSALLEIQLAPGQALPSGEVNFLLDDTIVLLNDTPPGPGECEVLPFTVIFEYCVPRHGCASIREWGKLWARPSRIPFGPRFNNTLQGLTDQFAAANADPARLPNRNALNQLRANEILNGRIWEMREWKLFPTDSDTGHLREVTTKQTPDFDFNLLPIIAEFVNANEPLILADQHTVPLQFKGAPFLSGSAPTPDGFFWNAPGIANGEARHKFSLITCSGCHSGETKTPFTHVFTRSAGSPSALSGFLTGITVPDPAGVTPPHQFNDLARREIDLLELIAKPCFMQIFREWVNFKH